MKSRKLNYRFHNPNPEAVAAEYILKVMMEVNMSKVEQAVKTAAVKGKDEKEEDEKEEGCPA